MESESTQLPRTRRRRPPVRRLLYRKQGEAIASRLVTRFHPITRRRARERLPKRAKSRHTLSRPKRLPVFTSKLGLVTALPQGSSFARAMTKSLTERWAAEILVRLHCRPAATSGSSPAPRVRPHISPSLCVRRRSTRIRSRLATRFHPTTRHPERELSTLSGRNSPIPFRDTPVMQSMWRSAHAREPNQASGFYVLTTVVWMALSRVARAISEG